MKKIVLIGAGGHSKSVMDCLEEGAQVIGYIDDNKTGEYYGLPIFGKNLYDVPNCNDCSYFVTIGDNDIREKWFKKIESEGLKTLNIIDKTAVIASNVKMGTGNFIGKYSIINSDSQIGNNNIINTRALIEHECVIGSNNHISTGSVINGNVVVEDNVFLGSMSTCIGQLRVGKGTIVGAGGVVTKDLPRNVTAVGVPVRIIKENK